MPINVFGGGAVQTAYVSFAALDLTGGSIVLVWPTSYVDVPYTANGINYNTLAASMTVNTANLNVNTITLPDATQSSVGANFIITNIGASSFALNKSDGTQLIQIPAVALTNSYWVQLTDNSTSAGVWQFVKFGAGTSSADAAVLAGNGLIPLGPTLNTNVPVKTQSNPYTVLPSDRASLIVFKGGAITFTLPGIATVPAGFYVSFNNAGTGLLTFSADAAIDSIVLPALFTIQIGQSLSLISDGAQWWSLGLGQYTTSNQFPNGSAQDPSINFVNAPTTGLYYYSPDQFLGFSVGGVQSASISGTTLSTLQGTAANPGMSFLGDTTTGIYYVGGLNPATLGFSVGGASVGSFSNNNGLTLTTPLALASGGTGASTPAGAITALLPNPLSIANGGTGSATQQAAIKALMPSTGIGTGSIAYYDDTGNWVILPAGADGNVLTMTAAGIPSWA